MAAAASARPDIHQVPLKQLAKVEDVEKLVHLTEDNRNKWKGGVQKLWQTIQSHPAHSEIYQNAYNKLIEVTKGLRQEAQKIQRNQQQQQQALAQANGNQQNDLRPISSGQPGQSGQSQPGQSGAGPQQQFSAGVMQMLRQANIVAPPQVQQKGQDVARKWVQDASTKYAQHLSKIESAGSRVAKLQQQKKAREGQGKPLNQMELEAFQNELARSDQFRKEAQEAVTKFQQAQKEAKTQLNLGIGSSISPTNGPQVHNVPSQNMDASTGNANQIKQEPQTQVHTVSSAVDAARNQADAGPRSGISPANGHSGQSAMSQPLNSRPPPHPMANAHTPLSINTNTRMSDQQHDSPRVTSAQSANITQGPIPLSLEQARMNSQPDLHQTLQSAGPSHGHPSENRGQNMILNQVPNATKMPMAKEISLPPSQPVSMGPSRPTLMNGPYQPGPIGQPSLPKLPGYVLEGDNDRVLSKKRLEELVRQVVGGTAGEGEDGEFLTAEVEETLLNVADDFVDQVTEAACRVAKIRGNSTLELRDIQLILERNYNIRIPGYASDELRTVKKTVPTQSWTQKLSAVQAAKVTGGKGDL